MFTGFLQVILVSINTFQISQFAIKQSTSALIGIVVVGFAISIVWSFNVKKIAFGSMLDRVVYASGAALGSILGVVLAMWVYKQIGG